MKRRDFMQVTVVAGATAAAGLGSCRQASGPSPPPAPQASGGAAAPFELENLSIADLQEGMTQGRFTARSLTETYLARIAAVDKAGPAVNAVIELNPDALVMADTCDRERREGHVRGPLHGIPVMVKDNFDSSDKMATTAGSLALAGSVAPRDAAAVRKLREAGAVLLGKTNLSEWANFRSTRSTSGWSGRGGQTRNPYALDRNPCGSSSGSAVAVAAGLCAAALGTETDGSVVCPSSTNGVVGIKPTVGLISRMGIIPIAHSQDTAGPMARTVADAAMLLGVLTGVDPEDPSTAESKGRSYTDYAQFLDPNGLKGARIGVARNFFGFHDGVDRLMEDALEAMKTLGAVIVDPADVANVGDAEQPEFEVLLFEFKTDLNAYLSRLGPQAPVRTLRDVIAFNDAHAEEEMPFFGQEILTMAEAKGPLSSQAYLDARATVRKLSREEGIDKTLATHRLDAIIAPTGGPAWMTDLINGDHFLGGSSSPAARAGYPNITVPAGRVFGLPVGLSFFAGPYSEPVLLKLAYAFEQATGHRKPPTFPPHVDLGKAREPRK